MGKRLEIVIVGGSAAGPSAAMRARRVSPESRIAIYERGNFISYGA